MPFHTPGASYAGFLLSMVCWYFAESHVTLTRKDRMVGCLIGTALGDSLLLPAEGLSRPRVARRFADKLHQRLFLGFGLVSDDTEHAFLTAQALLASHGDADRFGSALASRLRWWLLALPGGCGKATGLGLLRAWFGISPKRSGVLSAGNGPTMRSALIGLYWCHDVAQREAFVAASTAITHRDERALIAARAVAELAAIIGCGDQSEMIWSRWRDLSPGHDWQRLVDSMHDHDRRHASVDEFAQSIGCDQYVSGYAYHSVPVALYAWIRYRDDPSACFAGILRCGGDTDTMGAIAGALLGADHGVDVFPDFWLHGLREWPLSKSRLRAVGTALGEPAARTIFWWWPFQPLRNVIFLLIIIGHGFRRLLP